MIIPNKDRCVSTFFDALKNQPPRFQIGDVITFVCAEGWHHIVTILDIWSCGTVNAMVYDGQPHHVVTDLEELNNIRVVKLDRMGPTDVACYMSMLGLLLEMQEAA